MQPYNGILLVNKPEGYSSFRVVSIVRGILRSASGVKNIKVGHSGTLDPAATGLLVLAIGRYTKKVPLLIKQDKTYEVEMTLGRTSTTGDKEGDILVKSTRIPSNQEIVDVLATFTGNILQTPPIFSAIKVNGQRAYHLARQGKKVSLQPRSVTVHSNVIEVYEYPMVRFTSEVSSGTYIRSLVEDIGNALGTGAYMSNLQRTQIGTFSITDAIQLADLNAESINNCLLNIK